MKKQLPLLLTGLILFASAWPLSAAGLPQIRIKAAGYTEGTALLLGVFNEQQYKIDSAQIDATGTMTFKGSEPYKEGLVFVLLPDDSYFQALLTEDQTFELSTKKGKLVEEMVVTGSQENDIFYKNLKYENTYNAQFAAVSEQLKKAGPLDPNYVRLKQEKEKLVQDRKQHLDQLFTAYPNSFFTRFKKAGQNPELKEMLMPNGQKDTVTPIVIYRREFWDNVDFSDNRLMYTPVVFNKLKRYMTQLTPQIPDSIISAAKYLVDKALPYPEYYKFFANWITLNYEPTKSEVMDADAVYVFMVQHYFTHDKAFWSDTFELNFLQRKAEEMSHSLVGMKGPEVKTMDINGQQRAISDFSSEYVVVYLFSPECSHCQEESPKLVQFYKEWKSKGVEVYAIGVEPKREEWEKFVRNYNMLDFVNVNDPSNRAIYKKYYVDNTPEVYVLNPDRIIVGKNIKIAQIPDIIAADKKKRAGKE